MMMMITSIAQDLHRNQLSSPEHKQQEIIFVGNLESARQSHAT
jgi:hypothetical protein